MSHTSQSLLVFKQQINSFVRDVEQTYLLQHERDIERRSIPRVSVTIPIIVTPLDGDMRPLDYNIYAMTRDISAKGAGFVSTDPIDYRHTMLQFSPYKMGPATFISRIVYCKSIGNYFQVGCEFVTA